MDTYFAPAEKNSDKELAAEIELVSKNPLVSGLLHSISGLLAVLDEHRQIVALNDSFLEMLGVDNPEKALGLRHGEALRCLHAEEEPAGCGTTKFCSSCGAAIAIVSSMEQNTPVEKLCAITANRGDKNVDIALLVRSHPITIDKKIFLLIFLQDITRQQQRAALERTFFHDVNNMLNVLVGASEMLVDEEPSELARAVHEGSIRLMREVAIQRYLSRSGSCDYLPVWTNPSIAQILAEIRSFFANHPVAQGKHIRISDNYPDLSIKTDMSLLMRVLSNMITNAFEATAKNEEVSVWLEHEGNFLSFHVWNAREIPSEAVNRIFQRNFSTKGQAGRGIGTYSMKLFGEEILGGRVSFTTSERDGTVFTFAHPV
jgi:signal transduction histidine kinase